MRGKNGRETLSLIFDTLRIGFRLALLCPASSDAGARLVIRRISHPDLKAPSLQGIIWIKVSKIEAYRMGEGAYADAASSQGYPKEGMLRELQVNKDHRALLLQIVNFIVCALGRLRGHGNLTLLG
jgi:hypothetical protein